MMKASQKEARSNKSIDEFGFARPALAIVYFPGLTSPHDHDLKTNIVNACLASAPQMPLSVGWYRGHGKSPGQLSAITLDGMIEDVFEFLNEEDFARGPLDIHAHSTGALVALYVAAEIAKEHPESIRRVVCYAPPRIMPTVIIKN